VETRKHIEKKKIGLRRVFLRDTKNEKERQREKSHIIELAAGNLTEIKNIFQPCKAVTG
jgi:hypothetical protein